MRPCGPWRWRGRRIRTTVTAGFEHRGVTETDLLEREVSASALVATDAGGTELALRPFQIVTLRFSRT